MYHPQMINREFTSVSRRRYSHIFSTRDMSRRMRHSSANTWSSWCKVTSNEYNQNCNHAKCQSGKIWLRMTWSLDQYRLIDNSSLPIIPRRDPSGISLRLSLDRICWKTARITWKCKMSPLDYWGYYFRDIPTSIAMVHLVIDSF